MGIPFNKPFLTGNEAVYLERAAASARLGGGGEYSDSCQRWLAQRLDEPARVLLTHSCTGALEMCARLLELAPGDEVIVPSFAYPTTAGAFVSQGAVPVFVDIRSDTLNIDERLIEAAITERTRAICVVHYGGVACEMKAILGIAARRGLRVVEDAAHGLLASYDDRPLGTLGDLGAISFHATKNVTCGQGGALIVKAKELADIAETILDRGTNRAAFQRGEIGAYTWVALGSAYRLGELSAAFLWAQFEAADDITARRMGVWNAYHESFADAEATGLLQRPHLPRNCKHNAHIYWCVLSSRAVREDLLEYLRSRGIEATFHFLPLHGSPSGRTFGRASGTMRVTDTVSECVVRMPLFSGLSRETAVEIARVTADRLAEADG